MNLATITSIFQSHCHEGYSLCDVEVCDKQGNHICVIDKVEVMNSSTNKKRVRVIVHSKNTESLENSSYKTKVMQKLPFEFV